MSKVTAGHEIESEAGVCQLVARAFRDSYRLHCGLHP